MLLKGISTNYPNVEELLGIKGSIYPHILNSII